MKKEALLASLRCPACGAALQLREAEHSAGRVKLGVLHCEGCGARYPVQNFIPRFVPPENYAANFGFQWNEFRQTQLDSHSGVPVSRERFLKSTGLKHGEVEGKRVLDVGCGAGRFAEVALSLGADLTALDYSSAVDACLANLGHHPSIDVVQGDVFRLPFARESFDLVYCLGVLQHTPDAENAFMALARFVKPGGRLAVDIYPKLWSNIFWSKYWLRPITRRIPQQLLFRLVKRLVPVLLPVSDLLGRIPGFRRRLRYLVPVANYRGVLPLSEKQQVEWAILDTFDMLAPEHDHPQTAATLKKWFARAEFVDVEVFRSGHIVGYARRTTLS